jgi:hypothetical protein
MSPVIALAGATKTRKETKMAESESKSSKAKASDDSVAKQAESTGGPQDAPGPITAAHESGSSAQTKAVDEAREKLREAQSSTNK